MLDNIKLAADAATLSTLRAAAVAAASVSDALARTRAAAAEAAARAAEEAARANAAVSGVALAGGPIRGAAVSLRCSAGAPQTGQSTGADGSFSIKLEDQVLITETGCENLTSYPFDAALLGA